MHKISKKKLLVAATSLTLVVAAIAGGFVFFNKNSQESERGPRPSGNTSSNFLYQEVYYDCSQPVRGKWTEAGIGPMADPGWYFVPDSQSDLEKYCRMGAVIEYRAVIDILKREDVSSTIAKYDTTQAWVRALGHKYIHDKDYLKRILPAYSEMKIDCIIVVHSPEGTRFFIEDGEKHESHHDHHYREVPGEEFLTSLNNASPTDVTSFWLSLH